MTDKIISLKDWIEYLPHVNNFQVIRIIKGLFKGVEFTYGGVAFEETDDELKMSFEHNIVNDYILADAHQDSFKKITGDILIAILDEQMLNNSVIYRSSSEE